MRISDWSSDVCSSDLERRLLAAFGGKGDGAHVEQQRRISAIVYAAFADGHRAYGVAMIAMFQHQNAVTRLPAIVPMAKRHLQRHFHAGRTAVGKENAGEARGRNGDKATRHVFGRFMRVASENDLIELLALLSDCRPNARVAMDMHRTPPPSHAEIGSASSRAR